MGKLKTIDLFCGCGGMSLGFQNAGYDIMSAYDKWEPAVKVYRMNFTHPIYQDDLADPEVQERIIDANPEYIPLLPRTAAETKKPQPGFPTIWNEPG